MGRDADPMVICDYNPAWENQFADLSAWIVASLQCPSGEARHHLYVLVEGAAELGRHMAFRDALRADAALRDGYAQLKRLLAAQYPGDREAYTQGKSTFIQAVIRLI
jgi:GrpB-like predicted nucleotidyltransferase (UPF0157 family)